MPSTRILLTTGEWISVEGPTDDVSRRLEDASRSTTGTLAWLKELDGGQAVGVSPSHVVVVAEGEAAPTNVP